MGHLIDYRFGAGRQVQVGLIIWIGRLRPLLGHLSMPTVEAVDKVVLPFLDKTVVFSQTIGPDGFVYMDPVLWVLLGKLVLDRLMTFGKGDHSVAIELCPSDGYRVGIRVSAVDAGQM